MFALMPVLIVERYLFISFNSGKNPTQNYMESSLTIQHPAIHLLHRFGKLECSFSKYKMICLESRWHRTLDLSHYQSKSYRHPRVAHVQNSCDAIVVGVLIWQSIRTGGSQGVGQTLSFIDSKVVTPLDGSVFATIFDLVGLAGIVDVSQPLVTRSRNVPDIPHTRHAFLFFLADVTPCRDLGATLTPALSTCSALSSVGLPSLPHGSFCGCKGGQNQCCG